MAMASALDMCSGHKALRVGSRFASRLTNIFRVKWLFTERSSDSLLRFLINSLSRKKVSNDHSILLLVDATLRQS